MRSGESGEGGTAGHIVLTRMTITAANSLIEMEDLLFFGEVHVGGAGGSCRRSKRQRAATAANVWTLEMKCCLSPDQQRMLCISGECRLPRGVCPPLPSRRPGLIAADEGRRESEPSRLDISSLLSKPYCHGKHQRDGSFCV